MTEPYRIRDPNIWADAKVAYLRGFTADEVCERYDIGVSNFKRRTPPAPAQARQGAGRRPPLSDLPPLPPPEHT